MASCARDAEARRLVMDVREIACLVGPNGAWLFGLLTPSLGWPPDTEYIGKETFGHEEN